MLPQDNATSQGMSARCARHVTDPATTVCSRCGSYACVRCQRTGKDGQDYCFACVSRVQEEEPAERGDRFVANLVDQLIVFVPWLGASVLEALLAGGDFERGIRSGSLALLGFLASLGLAGYQLFLASRSGQTIGKRWRRIRVVRTDGSRASLGRILVLRNLIPGGLSSLCGLFGLVDALLIFGEERRCLHDILADTKVIKVSDSQERNPF